jgi:hypothetical protein
MEEDELGARIFFLGAMAAWWDLSGLPSSLLMTS